MIDEKINEYISRYPKESLKFVLIIVFLLWQSVAAILGLLAYFAFARWLKVKWFTLLSVGAALAFVSVLLMHADLSLDANIIINGFMQNAAFWRQLNAGGLWQGCTSLYDNALPYIIGIPFLFAGLFDLINLIPDNPHQTALQALQKGEDTEELFEKKDLQSVLDKSNDDTYEGTVLGVSKFSGNLSVIPDRDVNQVLLVLGTTGAGKTITLRRFYNRAVLQGYPLIIVDGKPDESNIAWLMALAHKHEREFVGFNCGNFRSYDPLSNGGFTELKDKIISLKDEWSNDYYRSIAEDYLQTTFEVLLKSKKPFDMKTVVNCLNFNELAMLVREAEDENLSKRVSGLEHYDRKDITGLQAHLNILIHSELGQFFEKNDSCFNLSDVVSQNAVVYFALPALRFPSFSKVLGKLVINDLKAVIDRDVFNKRIFTVFDEFSVFAGEQVLNLVNMGRGKGVHAIFGTQGLADLDRVDPTFKKQVLNCVNTLICHRLNDDESAESVASWVGTKNAFTVTAQINLKESNTALGSVRRNKEFIIHPDSIKQELQVGEAFYITKVGGFRNDKVKIKFI